MPGFSVFGLTGGLGSGKSTVAELLRRQGVPVVSADELAREVVIPGSAGLAEVVTEFGADVLTKNGALDRRALGEIVFRDPNARTKLNAILHPRIQKLAQDRFQAAHAAGARLIGYDIPLLFETGAAQAYRPVVVVHAPKSVRRARVLLRDGLDATEFERRDASQMPLEQKAAQADFVLENSGSRADLEQQVTELLPKLAAFRPPSACS